MHVRANVCMLYLFACREDMLRTFLNPFGSDGSQRFSFYFKMQYYVLIDNLSHTGKKSRTTRFGGVPNSSSSAR
jgi:hypothetical protein